MPANEIEKQYNELRKKHRLPDFREIDFELELQDIESTAYLLKQILRKIGEKLEFYSRVIEETLQPDASNIYALHESRFFDEKEKKEMYDVYVKLMNLSRHSLEISLSNDEKSEAEVITRFFGEWKDLKEELIKYARKMKESWKPWADIKEDLGYMG